MKNFNLLAFLALAGFAAFTSNATAQITWQPSVDLFQGETVETFVSDNGTLAVALNATNLASPDNAEDLGNVTVNGQTFVGAEAGTTVTGPAGESITINSGGNNEGAFGDGQFANNRFIFDLLQGGSFRINNVTLGGLVPGTVYEIQIIAHDARASREDAVVAFSDGVNPGPASGLVNLSNANTGDPTSGRTGDFIIGTFTADESTLTFDVFGDLNTTEGEPLINLETANSPSAINAIQLRIPDDGGLLGDIDLNGVVDFFDIQPFIDLLASQTFQFEGDIDGNGFVDFFDIQPFINILSGAP